MKSSAELTELTILIEVGRESFPKTVEHLAEEDTPDYSIEFSWQPKAGTWLAEGGDPASFRLLSCNVLDALIVEARDKGYPVRYLTSSGHLVRV